MKLNKIKIAAAVSLLLMLAACVSTEQRAVVDNGIIANPALGISGFRFEIPAGFELYNPAMEPPAGYNDLQQMAVRIHQLNNGIHPRGSERFYESFLLLSENSCFLLMTLEHDRTAFSGSPAPFGEETIQYPLMPLYNVSESQRFEVGEPERAEAVWSRGYAYEHKGWIYPGPRRGRRLFSYESCRITGGSGEEYILTGFTRSEQAGLLLPQMQDMIGKIRL